MDPFVEVSPAPTISAAKLNHSSSNHQQQNHQRQSSSSSSSSTSLPPISSARPPIPARPAQPSRYSNSIPDSNAIYPEIKGTNKTMNVSPNSSLTSASAAAGQQPVAKPVKTIPATSSAPASTSSSSFSSGRNPVQSPRSSPVPTSSSSASSSVIGPTSAAITAQYQKKSEPVSLNIYDLHPYNQYLHSLGFGAYHTAVQIFGREYSFGFHNTNDTGVFSMLPKCVPNAVFRETIDVGQIFLTYNQFNLILNQLKTEWTGKSYHLLKRNCNHFSSALLSSLGLKTPSFINRLASAGDLLAAVVPSFMLPKQVNMLIKDGRPDMGEGGEEPPSEMLNNVPSGRRRGSGNGGIPTLHSSSSSDNNWGGGSNSRSDRIYIDGDSMDEETFKKFLQQSEMEYQKQQELKKMNDMQSQTTRSSLASTPSSSSSSKSSSAASSTPSSSSAAMSLSAFLNEKEHNDCEGTRNIRIEPSVSPLSAKHSRNPSSSSNPTPKPYPQARRPSLHITDEEAKIDRAMREFQLPATVSAEERAQIRAVIRMSIQENSKSPQ